MIAFVFAAVWYLALAALAAGAALTGRPRRDRPGADLAETYELTRLSDRIAHARRVREEELAELRRRQGPRFGLLRATD